MQQPVLLAGILQEIAAVRPMYLVIWSALIAVSVFLIASMRTRWGRSRPLYRCAALSLIVHFLLIGVAMTVRLVVGSGANDGGPPIRVRVIDEVVQPGSLETIAPPPLLADAGTSPTRDETSSPEASEPAPPVEAPPLLEPPAAEPQPVAEASPAVEPTVDAAASESPATPALAADANSQAVTASDAAHPAEEPRWTEASVAETDPTAAQAAAAATSPYALRTAADRLRWAEEQGGSRETEAAVAAALAWLAKSQSSGGRWDASRFGAGVEMEVLGQNRGGAGADADPGISALALLAFLGAGQTHEQGDYRAVVRDGLDFLSRGQAPDGNLATGTGMYAQMYCHSMATFALAEALAMTGDKRLEPTVRRAVAYSIRAQHPSTGGWRYRVGDLGDTSQMGWQLMALWSADRAGLEIPPQTWTGAERFLRSVRRGRSGGLASYRPDGPASTPMTAEALYCRHMLREVLGGNEEAGAAREATSQLLATLPEAGRINLYYWYYATLALHYQQQSNDEAAQAWQAWNAALTGVLLDAQESDGSWPASCIWGGYGGRVYTTAVAALCLEVYYRYAPFKSQSGWIATRPQNGTGGSR